MGESSAGMELPGAWVIPTEGLSKEEIPWGDFPWTEKADFQKLFEKDQRLNKKINFSTKTKEEY